MGTGCVAELDMFLTYRQELPAERSVGVLRHVASCPLCHDLWRRFELDARVAVGIQCALRGDSAGADSGPAWAVDDELPDPLQVPGFRIRPGFIEGGQARVYRGTYEASLEEVAIKVFHNSLLNEGGQERFARELKSLARLRHPNVITIRSDGQISGHAYFVMPWIEGLALDEYVRRTPMTVTQRVDLVSKICDAVHHAHQRGVLHLDLKPTNVRVDERGEPTVMDFGLARLVESDLAEPPILRSRAAGTPLYMAPEQVENRDDLDVRADVYGLGLLLYEVLVGRRAKHPDLTRTQRPSLQWARELPPPPRTVDPRIPAELEAVTLRAIDVDRERRYQTAQGLYDDLQHFRQGRLVQAYAHRRLYRVRKWVHEYREAVAALGLIVLIVTFAVAIRFRYNRVYSEWMRYTESMSREVNQPTGGSKRRGDWVWIPDTRSGDADGAVLRYNHELVLERLRLRADLLRILAEYQPLARAAGQSDLAVDGAAAARRIRELWEAGNALEPPPEFLARPPFAPSE
jgi:tRNA A-37 threonylcarbamoyl transferase component Bud32